MSKRLWFYLDHALAVAEHAAAASSFDTSDADAVDEPALVLVGGDGIYLRSNALPTPTGTPDPPLVYAQGAHAASRHGQRRTATAAVLPLHPTDRDGLLQGLRQAAADGERWLVISLDDDDTGLTVYPRRTLEAVHTDNPRWAPATVQVFGVLGPYAAQVADGYRWFGWLVPRFTTAVVDAIIAALDTIAAPGQPGTVDLARRRGDTVEIIAAAGTDAEHIEVLHADDAGMFTLGAYRWCWEAVEADPHRQPPSTGPDTATGGAPGCLCPRRCLLCGAPVGSHHDPDCRWCSGSREGETPRLARQTRVLDRHAHQPGCRHAQPHPGGLFEQITAEGDVRCLICAAINTRDSDAIASFGGTTEYFARCTACGAGWGFCDLTAIR